MKGRMTKRGVCVICGARVYNHNPKANTCSPICTKAKHANRTRQEQFEYEMSLEPILIESRTE